MRLFTRKTVPATDRGLRGPLGWFLRWALGGPVETKGRGSEYPQSAWKRSTSATYIVSSDRTEGGRTPAFEDRSLKRRLTDALLVRPLTWLIMSASWALTPVASLLDRWRPWLDRKGTVAEIAAARVAPIVWVGAKAVSSPQSPSAASGPRP